MLPAFCGVRNFHHKPLRCVTLAPMSVVAQHHLFSISIAISYRRYTVAAAVKVPFCSPYHAPCCPPFLPSKANLIITHKSWKLDYKPGCVVGEENIGKNSEGAPLPRPKTAFPLFMVRWQFSPSGLQQNCGSGRSHFTRNRLHTHTLTDRGERIRVLTHFPIMEEIVP